MNGKVASKMVFEDKNSQDFKALSGYMREEFEEVCEPLPGDQSIEKMDFRCVLLIFSLLLMKYAKPFVIYLSSFDIYMIYV